MFTKSKLAALVSLTLLSATISTAHAATDPASKKDLNGAQKVSSASFTKPVLLTDEEIKLAHANAVHAPANASFESYFSKLSVSPDLVSPNWKYSDLWPGGFIDTQETYNVSTSGQSVTVVLCQYPDATLYGGSVANASYTLIPQGSGVITNPYILPGNYDSKSHTFSFHNVYKGVYKLRITNLTKSGSDPGFDMAGNGFVYYY